MIEKYFEFAYVEKIVGYSILGTVILFALIWTSINLIKLWIEKRREQKIYRGKEKGETQNDKQ